MRYSNRLFLFLLVLSFTACATPPVESTAPVATPTATRSVPPTASPTAIAESSLRAGQWSYIFYHEGLKQVVLVNGGPEHGKPADDPLELWGWNGAQWSLLQADDHGPPWRNWPAAAYDSDRDVLVIHGGLQPGRHFDETWEWDGETWTLFKEERPGGREGALMVYDAERAKMILFGGSTPDWELHGDTWAWDGENWNQISQTGPAPRFPGGMIYDSARQEVLLYSGHFAAPTGEAIDYDDLWAWDGTSWRQIVTGKPTPGHRTHSGLVYDPNTERVLLIASGSGTFLSDVWSWDGKKWEELQAANTPTGSGHNVAYDPTRDRFVLFGGVDRPGGMALDDTWEWDRVQWSCVSNCR